VNDSSCPKLSYKHRFIGFCVCAITGTLLSVCGPIFLIFGEVFIWAIFYSVGNVISVASTAFVIGPLKQLKSMTDSGRLIATIIFFAACAGTILLALLTESVVFSFVCVIVQYLAFAWYSLSFIPFARTAFLKTMESIAGSE